MLPMTAATCSKMLTAWLNPILGWDNNADQFSTGKIAFVFDDTSRNFFAEDSIGHKNRLAIVPANRAAAMRHASYFKFNQTFRSHAYPVVFMPAAMPLTVESTAFS